MTLFYSLILIVFYLTHLFLKTKADLIIGKVIYSLFIFSILALLLHSIYNSTHFLAGYFEYHSRLMPSAVFYYFFSFYLVLLFQYQLKLKSMSIILFVFYHLSVAIMLKHIIYIDWELFYDFNLEFIPKGLINTIGGQSEIDQKFVIVPLFNFIFNYFTLIFFLLLYKIRNHKSFLSIYFKVIALLFIVYIIGLFFAYPLIIFGGWS